VTRDFRDAINEICRLLNAGISTPADLAALKAALEVLEELLLDNEDCIDEEIAEDLLELINIIQAAATVAAIPPGTLDELGRQLNKLRRCLGLRVRVCRPGGGGGGGQFECDCNLGQTGNLLIDINAVLEAFAGGDATTIANALAALVARLSVPPNEACVDAELAASIIDFIATISSPPTPSQEDILTDLLISLVLCLGLGLDRGSGQAGLRIAIRSFLQRNNIIIPTVPTVPTTPIVTIRQQLLDLVADQVAITTPTGIYVGTLVTVQVDYIAVVNAVGTYLIPIDEITAFTTE